MNQRDLEIIVPATGESAASLREEDDENRIILRFPAVVATEPGLFDTGLEEMLNLAERDQPPRAIEAWLKRHAPMTDTDMRMLKEAHDAFRRLQREGRSHIWSYVARNLSRPIWLASEKQKADVVIVAGLSCHEQSHTEAVHGRNEGVRHLWRTIVCFSI
jgi:hypothetical protein